MQLDYVARKREFCISRTLIQQWLLLVHGNTNLLYFLYASKNIYFYRCALFICYILLQFYVNNIHVVYIILQGNIIYSFKFSEYIYFKHLGIFLRVLYTLLQVIYPI